MLLDEPLLPGPEAIEKVTGTRPHYSQFFRWTQKGLKATGGRRVCLEFTKAGRKRLTSIAAVKRFFQVLANAANYESSLQGHEKNRTTIAFTEIEALLDEAGL